MSKYPHHLLFVILVSIVTLIVNVLAFYTRNVSNYLYLFDIAYVIGNSAHFVALSISSNGISVEDERDQDSLGF
ncbi:membrane protein [Cuniculiplasma divulgatum]|uniref:Membrane protein n=1 Tax=Cuniculiplasma divulgatum TaxID=1673428 RepID=A0A1N5WFW6_9ARCH|nr:membrane protein [Cuniculiplasma divulgatum]